MFFLSLKNVFLLLTDQCMMTSKLEMYIRAYLCICWPFCANLQIWAYFWLYVHILHVSHILTFFCELFVYYLDSIDMWFKFFRKKLKIFGKNLKKLGFGTRLSTKTKSGQNFTMGRGRSIISPWLYICAFNFAPITFCEKERSFSVQTLYERSEDKDDRRKYRNAFCNCFELFQKAMC